MTRRDMTEQTVAAVRALRSVLDPLTYEETSAVSERAFELGGMPGVVEWRGVAR